MLGVTFSRKFSVLRHVSHLLPHYFQLLFALRTLRQHGLPADALQVVFQVIVVNKLSYAFPAWCGFASADDQNRLEAFYDVQLNSVIVTTAQYLRQNL